MAARSTDETVRYLGGGERKRGKCAVVERLMKDHPSLFPFPGTEHLLTKTPRMSSTDCLLLTRIPRFYAEYVTAVPIIVTCSAKNYLRLKRMMAYPCRRVLSTVDWFN